MFRRKAEFEIRGTLTLYTRSECTLCELLERRLRRLVRGELDLRYVDVDADPELARRYGHRIPVLSLGERELCEGRVEPEELAALLQGLAEEGRMAP